MGHPFTIWILSEVTSEWRPTLKAYISSQFEPYENNSVTLWMALDNADEETGCVEYAACSHKWRPILHKKEANKYDNSSEDIDTISSFHSSDEASYRDSLLVAAKLAAVSDPHDKVGPVPTKEGYAIMHHQDVWHGSGPNLSTTKHRRSLVAHFIRGDVTFRERSGPNTNGPFGNVTYIYGRYKRYERVDLDESFFPIIYGPKRTEWIDDFVGLVTIKVREKRGRENSKT